MNSFFTILIAISAMAQVAFAQNDGSLTLDMLKAPASPAFILLGISPTDVQKPVDPTELFMNIKNASNNFTTLPSEYALQICPAQIFGKTQSMDAYMQSSCSKGKQNDFAQSLTISF